MKVYIFTEAGREIGFGHVARCHALMQAFQEQEVSAEMYVNGSFEGLDDLAGEDFTLSDWVCDAERFSEKIDVNDIVIIDSYKADAHVYELITEKADRCLFFDDYHRIDYPKGYILNPAEDGEDGFYGLKYAILRKAYWNTGEKDIAADIGRIFVSLGGTAEVSDITDFCLMLGNKFTNVDIAVLSKGVKGGYYGLDDSETAELMKSCDIAVTAGGQTMLELAACGVPAVIIKTAENQNSNIRRFIEGEMGIYDNDFSPESVAQKALTLMNADTRQKISKNLKKAVDGQGARRIVRKLLEMGK